MDDRAWNNWLMATAVTWDDISPVVAETGVEAVDDGLRSLILRALRLNQLIGMIDSGHFNASLVEEKSFQLSGLHDGFSSLFQLEKNLIQKGLSPDADKHLAEHGRILNWLDRIGRDFAGGRVTALRSFRSDFLEGLIRHINEMDRRTYRLENWTAIIGDAARGEDLAFLMRSMEMADIDREHGEILDKILDYREDASFLKELAAVAAAHFKNEEAFISVFGEQELEAHKREHASILGALMEAGHLPSHLPSGNGGAAADKKTRLALLWLNHVNGPDHALMVKGRWWEKVLDSGIPLDEMAFVLRPTGDHVLDSAMRQVADRVSDLNGVYGVLAEDKADGAGSINAEKALDDLYHAVKELAGKVENAFGGDAGPLKKGFSGLNEALRHISGCKRDFHEDRMAVSARIRVNVLGPLIRSLNKLHVNGAAVGGR